MAINIIPRDGDGLEVDGRLATRWNASHAPAANTKATITKAAPVVGYRHVVSNLTVVLVAGAAAPTATTISVALIDGGTGGTTYLWGPHTLAIPAVAGAVNGIAIPGKWPGSDGTAITLEFSAAAGANTVESVSMQGYTVTLDTP